MFKEIDDEITEEEITEVLQSLIAKGYVRSFVKDGVVMYEATQEGRAVRDHSNSDPKLRN